MSKIADMFEKHDDEFLKFEKVENPLHARPDICAFLLLDKILPEVGRDIVVGAAHDLIYLEADSAKLAEIATEADVITLVRCGVIYDSETNGLAMFV